MKKLKRYIVGADSETYAISLVEEPAIEENFIALKKDEEKVVFLQSEEKHMLYGAVLVPDFDIYRNDGENEYYISFTSESIEKMSQDFMKEYRQGNVTLDHETDASEVTVVESWIKSDLYKDKSVALGLNENLPVGTWFCGMKVNNIETWERVKSGELRGFSVESMVQLLDFNKQVKQEESMELNETFWDKLRNVLSEAFAKFSMQKKDEEPEMVEEMMEAEAETPAGEATEAVETPVEPVSEPEVDNTPVEEEKPVTEPENKPEDKPAEQEPNPLEELVRNLMEEVKSLKEMNDGLNEKIKDMGKQPSAQPTNTNAKAGNANSYSAWREKMRSMIG